MKRLFFTSLLLLSATALFAAEPTILVIESYHSGYAWDASYMKGLREGLGENVRLVTFEMDTKRLPKSLYQKQARSAWQKYLETKPDLVILGDDNAMKYLGPKFLDTKTPVVYLGVNNNPEDYVPSGRNFTGILERPLYDFSIRTISQLIQPKPKKILVLFDHGTTSRASVVEAFKGKTRVVMHDVEVEMSMIGKWEVWKQTVLDAQNRGFDAIVVGLYHTLVDQNGHNVPADEVMRWTAVNTPVPPFGFWDFSVGSDKTIGGFVLSGHEQGKAATGMARQILEGTSPAEIPPKVGEKGTFVFSRKQLKNYGLSLPKEIRSKTQLVD